MISEQFRQALDMMNRAVSAPQGLLGQQPGAKESMAYLTNVERQQEMDRCVKPRREYDVSFLLIVLFLKLSLYRKGRMCKNYFSSH